MQRGRRYPAKWAGATETIKAKLMAWEQHQSGAVEHRLKPRIYSPFPMLVEGHDSAGRPFKLETVLDNLSVTGLYFRVIPQIKQGTPLSIVIQLSGSIAKVGPAPTIRIEGTVLRVEPKNGACGVAVAIKSHRFI